MKIAPSHHEQLGLELGTRLGGESFASTVAALNEFDPELGGYLAGYAYGQVMSRPALGLEERELCIIAALAALGHLPQLKWHASAALNIGIEAQKIREVLIQVVPFAGWPSAINAINAYREVGPTPERAGRGPAKTRAELRERGLARGGEVYPDYRGLEDNLRAFDPDLPDYLTENSYGQIFDRPALNMRVRELAAVAMLTGMQRLPQLAGHIVGAHRVGATPAETKEVIIMMHLYAGWPATINALNVWKAGTQPR